MLFLMFKWLDTLRILTACLFPKYVAEEKEKKKKKRLNFKRQNTTTAFN